MIRAGSAKIDITPKGSVWMDGMIRSHKSEGVHDPIYARALVLFENDIENAVAIISVEVCAIPRDIVDIAKQSINSSTGIPIDNIVIAATHTHSGPAAFGYFNTVDAQYLSDMICSLTAVTTEAAGDLRAASIACESGQENTISFYRRFMSEDGRTVMIWEEDPSVNDLEVLGEPDPEVGVLKVVDASDPQKTISVLFNHAGHPNVMSGENYLISGDYPGAAARMVEEELGGVALFVNGAQGTMDIDNWKYRDWDGVEHLGRALADAVISTAGKASPLKELILRSSCIKYTLSPRKISPEEIKWAEEILTSTDGTLSCMPDGVGDDYKALLYKKLRENEANDVAVEQTCIAIGNTAFITFPGELFTEIGMRIKAESPFKHTYIMGLVNGNIGYVPAIESIPQGGYEVDTREICDDAENIIVERSLELLNQVRLAVN